MIKNLFFFLLLPLSLTAQNINFSDPAFKAALVNINDEWGYALDENDNPITVDSNQDGEVQFSEALAVYKLNLIGYQWGGTNVTSLNGVEEFANLRQLIVNNSAITQLNLSGLTNLEKLYCSDNNLTLLNVEGLQNLQILNCSNNSLQTLDLSGLSNLEELDAKVNNLETLILPVSTNFTILDVEANQLTSINLSVVLNIEDINVYDNNLSDLNLQGLLSLQKLNCGYNNLSNLNLQELVALERIECPYNSLSSLNLSQNTNVEVLICNDNLIDSLTLGNNANLLNISCSGNNLSTLDVSGCHNLLILACENNAIASLDVSLNPALYILAISDNPLVYLNLKNGVANDFSNGNFSLLVANNFSLQYVCVDPEDLPFVQAIVAQVAPDCIVNPYCSFSSTGEYKFNGLTLFSSNPNCNSSFPAPLQAIEVLNQTASGIFMSNSEGGFSVPVAEGSYIFTPVNPNPGYYVFEPESVEINFSESQNIVFQSFCITATTTVNDIEIQLIPLTPARPGFDSVYRIIMSNAGTTTLSGAITFEFMYDLMDFVSSTTLPDNMEDNHLQWQYNNLMPFEKVIIDVTMNINSPIETPAVVIDDQLDFAVFTNLVEGDLTPANNNFAIKQTVVGSYDPNEKICVEGKSIPFSKVGDNVHYIIRFENTGNYFAENIVVEDIIDLEKFDLSTLTPISGSHLFETRVGNENEVEFVFDNIMLPGLPSEERHGYVIFKIKTIETLQMYDTFSNSANIYFDYNAPVATNTYFTMVAPSLSIADFNLDNEVQLYPNPAEDLLNIKTPEGINILGISIYNNLGQAVIAAQKFNRSAGIDVSSLPTSVYLIKLFSDKGIISRQFIKK